jgi:hypothetical protein
MQERMSMSRWRISRDEEEVKEWIEMVAKMVASIVESLETKFGVPTNIWVSQSYYSRIC